LGLKQGRSIEMVQTHGAETNKRTSQRGDEIVVDGAASTRGRFKTNMS